MERLLKYHDPSSSCVLTAEIRLPAGRPDRSPRRAPASFCGHCCLPRCKRITGERRKYSPTAVGSLLPQQVAGGAFRRRVSDPLPPIAGREFDRPGPGSPVPGPASATPAARARSPGRVLVPPCSGGADLAARSDAKTWMASSTRGEEAGMPKGPPMPVGRLLAREVQRAASRVGGRIRWMLLRRHADQDGTDRIGVRPRNRPRRLKCALAPGARRMLDAIDASWVRAT